MSLLSDRFALSYGHRLTTPFINAHHGPQRWLVQSTTIAEKIHNIRVLMMGTGIAIFV